MGQTLTHGVYLPNEGERNCYSGLAANWRLLDGAIGTVAAHTTAIAGKADISHAHGNISNDGKVGTTANVPLITGTGGVVQAGSFGTSANTFCEGNDSRLSDARTPVAHTHTKSDVTDLLNSNFIPSANNSYDLGSSSYQWNNLYAKNYYYNGVAWGLDKQNEWTNFQRMTSNPAAWYLRNNTVTLGTTPSTNRYIGMFFEDVNGANLGYAAFQANRNGYNSIVFSLTNSDGTNTYTGGFRCTASPAGAYSLFPENSECDLGISTNKWKTLNGVNPGALSLPDTLGTSGAENVNYFNVIGYLNNTGTLGTIPSTATYDGWLYINAKDGADSYIIIDDSPASFGTSVFGNNGLGSQSIGLLCLMCPIRKGHSYNVRIKSAGIVSARIYPAQGNV